MGTCKFIVHQVIARYSINMLPQILSTFVILTVSTALADKPWFCHDLDCPSYKVAGTFTEKKDGFEVRCYPKTVWAMTQAEFSAKSSSFSTGSLFMKLFKYISGNNKEGKKVAMTAPVFTHGDLKKGDNSTRVIKMHFFVPPAQESTIPAPAGDDIEIVTVPADCYFVHSFGGFVFSMGRKIRRETGNLVKSLEKAGIKSYDLSKSMYAGYDSPFRLFGRHNEVWLAKM